MSENGFKFSTSKTVCIHFHQQYGFFPDPNILLGKTPIKVVREAKFLGVVFDMKLTFKNHIQYLKTSFQKALEILRVVGHTDWGADPNILLGKTPIKVVREAKFLAFVFDTKLTFKNHIQYLKTSFQKALEILRVMGHTDWGADRIILLCLYRSLVRSKLDYGCIVYGSAHRPVLKQLDQIHHQGLRIVLGAFHTCPAQSLYIEAHEPSLTTRRLKLSLNYILKLKSLLENPAYSCVF